MERKVEFNSCGDTVRGVLHTPDGATGPVPLIILAGGWCYVKEIVMPYYAKAFTDIGVACLLFDYRNFGDSGGEPRQHIDPWGQIEDYRNAVSFGRTLDEIDNNKIGIWGISYSGGHVIITASLDPRVKFAISTIPVVDGYPTMRRCHGERKFAGLMAMILEDRERRHAGQAGGTMPMSTTDPDNELSAWPFPHVCTIFNDIKQNEAPNHEHINTIESVELLLAYQVKPYAVRIHETPIMMAVAKGDNITSSDLEIETFNAIQSPNKHLAVVEGVDHMSLYSNTTHLAKVAGVQADWLQNLLFGGAAQLAKAAE